MTEAGLILEALARIEAGQVRIEARQVRIEARLDSLGVAPACELTLALAETFGASAFTAREVVEKAGQLAARDVALGIDPEGLPRALFRAKIGNPHAFGRWAKDAPGLTTAGTSGGSTLWVARGVSLGVEPPKALCARPPGSEARGVDRQPAPRGQTGENL